MSDIRRSEPEPATGSESSIYRPTPLVVSSGLVMVLSALAGLVALGCSLYFFLGFAENDAQPGVLLSAFLLCFGVGALGYIPMFWIASIARKVLRKGRQRSDIIIVLALIIPWVLLAIVLIATGWPLIVFGIIIAGLSVFILTWAWALMREK